MKHNFSKVILEGSMKIAFIELFACIVIGVLGYNILPGILLGLVWLVSLVISIPVSKLMDKVLSRKLSYSIQLVIAIILWIVISAPMFIIWAQIP